MCVYIYIYMCIYIYIYPGRPSSTPASSPPWRAWPPRRWRPALSDDDEDCHNNNDDNNDNNNTNNDNNDNTNSDNDNDNNHINSKVTMIQLKTRDAISLPRGFIKHYSFIKHYNMRCLREACS